MFSDIWFIYIYQPLFNGLIWIYNNWTDQNFGLAVIYFTVIIRVILIPFSLFDAHKKKKNDEIKQEIFKLTEGYKHDSVLQKQEIRKLLKKRKVSPWAKAVVLGIQVVIFLELYQIFVHGVSNEKVIQTLYSFIDFPGVINTKFYGFDLAARHDVVWSLSVALLVFFTSYFSYRKQKKISQSDLAYLVLFPLAIFVFLYTLPMVKALFFLTTMLFSVILNQCTKLIFPTKKEEKP